LVWLGFVKITTTL